MFGDVVCKSFSRYFQLTFVQPCRALKRGFFLLITYSRPRRRTTWQLRSRDFRVFKELATFICSFPSFTPAIQFETQSVTINRQSQLKDQVRICFSQTVLSQFSCIWITHITTSEATITVWNFMQILLMIIFCIKEIVPQLYFGGDRAKARTA